ncbi:MAG: response regulator [Spirochaetia bacterium]|nr:response regulator [Spirochaetia bacterium]
MKAAFDRTMMNLRINRSGANHGRLPVALVALVLAACTPDRGSVAQDGIMDLRALVLDREVKLDGEWDFFPGATRELAGQKIKPVSFVVPGSWTTAGKAPGGVGLFRLRLLLPADRKDSLSLFIPNIHSAYRLYLNGNFSSAVGQPGLSPGDTTPQLKPQLVRLPDQSEVEILVEVSNFHHRNAGLWKSIYIGRSDQLEAKWTRQSGMEWVASGFFVAFALLFIMVYLGAWRHKEFLYFGIFTFLMAIRSGLTEHRVFVQAFDIPFALNYRAEYLTFILIPAVFAALIFALFATRQQTSLFVLRGLMGLSGVLSIIVVLTDSLIYTQTYYLALAGLGCSWLFVIYLVSSQIVIGRKDAILFLLAGLLPLSATLNDFLHNQNYIMTAHVSQFAAIAFVFFMAALVARRVNRIEKEKERIVTISRARSDFFASMSHDLRTPLNAIVGTLQLFDQSNLTPEQRRQTGTISNGAEFLLQLVNDILDLSRLEAGKMELTETNINLRSFLEQTVGLVAGQALLHGNKLELDISPRVPANILVDPFRLRQVLLNLLGNALKFTESGRIGVSCGLAGRQSESIILDFAVSDTGIGIPEAMLPLIFEQFQTGARVQTRNAAGSGLGLFIANQLVRLLGGALGVHSEVGKGTEFNFKIPVHQGVEEKLTEPAEMIPAMIPPRTRVLIADDDVVSLTITVALATELGIQPEQATDGAAALDAWKANRYALMILDIQMPVMDGISVARAIRQIELDSAAARTVLIAVTASAMPFEVRSILEAGFDFVVPKPVRRNELHHALQSASSLLAN